MPTTPQKAVNKDAQVLRNMYEYQQSAIYKTEKTLAEWWKHDELRMHEHEHKHKHMIPLTRTRTPTTLKIFSFFVIHNLLQFSQISPTHTKYL